LETLPKQVDSASHEIKRNFEKNLKTFIVLRIVLEQVDKHSSTLSKRLRRLHRQAVTAPWKAVWEAREPVSRHNLNTIFNISNSGLFSDKT
jgi:hypothetical protein